MTAFLPNDTQRVRRWPLGKTALLILGSLSLFAAPGPKTLSTDLSSDEIARTLRRVERQEIPEELREQILAKYKEALNASRKADFYMMEKERHAQLNKQYGLELQSIQRQLRSIESEKRTHATVSGSTEQVRQELARAQGELAGLRASLSDIERISRLRTQRRAEIANRVAVLNQELIRLDEMQAGAAPSADVSIGRAIYVSSLAARKAAQNEVLALRAETDSYDNHAELPSLRLDLAERRVTAASRTVQELVAALRRRTAIDSEALRTRVYRECEEAVRLYPFLRKLAGEVREYAELLAAPGGVREEADTSRQHVSIARTDLAQMRRIVQSSRRKFQAAGIYRDAAQWFPEIPAFMPTIPALKDKLHQREGRISEIEHEISSLENARTKQGDLEAEAESLPITAGIPASSLTPSMEADIRQLLHTRRDLQGELLSTYSHTLTELLELNLLSRSLLVEEEQLSEFVRERILWVKSVPGPALPAWSDLRAAAIWLAVQPAWSATFSNAVAKVLMNPVGSAGAIGILGLLILFRRRFARGLTAAGRCTSADSFTRARKAFLYTLLLALPLPALLFGLGWLIMTTAQTPPAANVGTALRDVGVLALALGFVLAMVRKSGLAEDHLYWPADTARHIHRVLSWAVPAFLVTAFVHLSFGKDVTHYIGQQEQVAAANSLGRVAFILAVGCAFIATSALLRPRGAVVHAIGEYRAGSHASWSRFVWLPMFSSIQILVAVLALTGYYITAFVLMHRASKTVLAGGVLLLLVTLLGHWRASKLRRLAALNTVPAANPEDEPIDPEIEASALKHADDQVRRFLGFMASTVMLFCTLFIWSDLLPSLKLLERITLFPSIGVISEKELSAAGVTAPVRPTTSAVAPTAEKTAESSTGPSSSDSATAQLPANAIPKAPPPASNAAVSYITLADLLRAILIVIATVLLAKDIPGPLQFLLRRPLPSAGDRNAVATIVKYLIVMIGISAAVRQFGLRWSQIQWLAAAFSFGIAFGLQEIFANFVSGIIILVERPMAVGDMCKFGSQMGKIEAIGLRSTRVRALDRTIIIVPNADFSKKEVVNFAKRDRMLIQTTLQLRLDTTEDQLRSILTGIHQLLLNHPRMITDPARVRFAGWGSYSLDIEIFVYADSTDMEEFLKIREDLCFDMLEIVRGEGTDLAMPSQTTYLTRDPTRASKQTAG